MHKSFTFKERSTMLILNSCQEQMLNRAGCEISKCAATNWVLDYSISACGCCRSGGTPWLDRSGGIAHLYPPGARYEENHQNIQHFHSAFLLFSGNAVELERLIDNPYHFARILDPERFLQKLLQQTVDMAASGGNDGYLAAYQVFCRIQSLLFSLTDSGEDQNFTYVLHENTVSQQPVCQKVRAELERNYAKKITIAAIAKKMGMSVSGLSHQYRKETGEPIFDTLQRIRIEQSLPMLCAGRRLKEIAQVTGFSDEFYYSKVFKRIYGSSPRKFFPKNLLQIS